MSSSFPPYSGEYDVGTIDIETPCQTREISDAIFKSTGKPAFEV